MGTENSEKTIGQRRPKGWQKGQSGNPGGRPRQTDEQKEALERIRELAFDAPNLLSELIYDARTPAGVRLRAIEIVLDRTYGKPVDTLRMTVKDETPKAALALDIRDELERMRTKELLDHLHERERKMQDEIHDLRNKLHMV